MAKDFHWCRRFEIRPKTVVHFSTMKGSWKLLHHVVEYDSHPGNDQLIKIGEDALPKMNPNGQAYGQAYVFHTILQVLEKSAAWQSFLDAMHSDKLSSI